MILTYVDLLIEQANTKPPPNPALAKMAAAIVPSIAGSMYLYPVIKNFVSTQLGIDSTHQIGGLDLKNSNGTPISGLTKADFAAKLGTGGANLAGVALATKAVDKFYEKRHGIPINDNRNNKEKVQDRSMKVGRLITGAALGTVGKAAIGTALTATGIPIASGFSGVLPFMLGSMVSSNVNKKIWDPLQNKIQEKRQSKNLITG